MLADEAGLTDEQAEACLALAAIRTRRRVVRRRGARRSASSHPLLDEGLDELAAVVEGAASLHVDRLPVVADLQHRPRPRLLHRHRLRDPDGRLRAARLDLLRRPLRRAGHRRPDDLPRRRHLARASPGCSCRCSRRGLLDRVAGRCRPCVLVALPDEDDRGRLRRDRAARCARAGIAAEVAPSRAEVRQADPLRRAARHPVRLVPAGRRDADEVKDIRSGEQVDADPALGPAGRRPAPDRSALPPPTADLRACTVHAVRRSSVIRTHEAGTLRAAHAGADRHPRRLGGPPPRPRRRGLHRPARRLRRRPGRRSATTQVAHGAAQRVLPARSSARCGRGPRATRTRTCRPARSRWSPPSVEVLNEAAPLPFQIDEHVEVGEEARLQLPLPRPAPARPGRGAAAAQRGQPGRPRGAARARLRRDRDADADPVDARGRPRLPGAGPAAARAAGTRCRSRRSCSSSC